VANWKGSLKAIAVGTATGTAIGLLSFFFLRSHHNADAGATLFLLVPISAGFSIALVARKPDSIAAATALSVLASLCFLVGMGAEGVLCAVLAFPIIAGGLFIGVGIGVLFRKLVVDRVRSRFSATGLLLVLAPALIVSGEKIESPELQHPRIEVVRSTVRVNGSPNQVWREILSIDYIKAGKPFLMYIGLPIPQRCTIAGTGVGAKRTCYFNVGYIEETVTEWNPPYYMGLSIDRTHMPGRHWLGFESADYRLEPLGNTTMLTRRTVAFSYLHPTWYWRGFERFGIESEHNYILRDVALKMAN
jgi:hypothetical protein